MPYLTLPSFPWICLCLLHAPTPTLKHKLGPRLDTSVPLSVCSVPQVTLDASQALFCLMEPIIIPNPKPLLRGQEQFTQCYNFLLLPSSIL